MYKAEYKAGDKVVLKPWKIDKAYGKEVFKIHKKYLKDIINNEYKATINSINGGMILFDELPLSMSFVANVILGYAFKWGEEIEVLDSDGRTVNRKFIGYNFEDSENPILASINGNVYEYARPIKKVVHCMNSKGESICTSSDQIYGEYYTLNKSKVTCPECLEKLKIKELNEYTKKVFNEAENFMKILSSCDFAKNKDYIPQYLVRKSDSLQKRSGIGGNHPIRRRK